MNPDLALNPAAFQFTVFLFFVFGSLLGSFCNVVILRMAEEKSIVFPPSSCPHCQHRLSPLDLIPIFGWVFLRGQCRYCRAPISIQYPLVETGVALTLSAAFFASGFTPWFIPQAGWAVIWLVISVLWFRGEVKKPWPFLWPLGLRILLGLWAGRLVWGEFALPLFFGCLSTALMRWRNPGHDSFGWFGVSFATLMSTLPFQWTFPAGLLALSLYYTVFPIPEPVGPSLKRGWFFLWSLAGMAICGWFGTWGFH